MITTVTLSPAPLGGGVSQPTLSESIWLGGSRFLMVSAQTTPTVTTAAVIDLSVDPYTAGATQTVTSNVVLGSFLPLERPMLMRLDYNRVLMIYSTTKKAGDFVLSTVGNRSTDLTFAAAVIEIDGTGTPSLVYNVDAVAPASFMNASYRETSPYTSGAKGSTNIVNLGYLGYANPNSAVLFLAANRLLIAAREGSFSGGAYASGTHFIASASLYDVSYAAGALTIAKRISLPLTTYGTANSLFNLPATGRNDFPWVYQIPGTTSVVFGYINYDPSQGGVQVGGDQTVTATSTSGFQATNTAYVVDYTQGAASWTASATITFRRLSMLCPLDSNRLLEVTGQVCATGTTVYSRVLTLNDQNFTTDMFTDHGQALQNANGSAAYGLINQVTNLGSDHVLMSVCNRSTATSYWGIYRLVGGLVMQCTKAGVPALSPYTFQRGQDAIQMRSVYDPAVTGNSAIYDFVARTAPLAWSFLRYANPA